VSRRTIQSGAKQARLKPGQPELRDQYRKIGIAAVASAVHYQGDRSNPRRASVQISKRQGKSRKI
jgi:hypothetical protein